jgi:hypothetical protein
MGIETHDVEFLLEARGRGVDFGRTLTIGRQEVKVPGPVLARFLGSDPDSFPSSRYAEPLFEHLGAAAVDSLDASSYEQATIVHDLNEPVDPALHGRYTAVYDGGSLEHVFNFPVAIRSCMEMVAPGGHLLLQSPANNQCGHGFYQFSPELLYRVLSAENGFEVERMVAVELYRNRRFEVADPADVGGRVELTNARPVLLLVQARRTTVVPLLRRPPQQSDYAAAWGGAPGGGGGRGLRSLVGATSRRHPGWVRTARRLYMALGGQARSAPDLRNRRYFRPVGRTRQ